MGSGSDRNASSSPGEGEGEGRASDVAEWYSSKTGERISECRCWEVRAPDEWQLVLSATTDDIRKAAAVAAGDRGDLGDGEPEDTKYQSTVAVHPETTIRELRQAFQDSTSWPFGVDFWELAVPLRDPSAETREAAW